jgi:hypothetical protein
MSTLTPILSIPFLLSLGISLILIGFVGVFFYQKITEQNHKISSMVDLISTMAEEMNYIRSRVQSGGAVTPLPSTTTAQQIPFFNSQENPNLIHVSDDEGESEEDDESEDEDDDDEDDDDEDDDDDEEDSDDEDEQENVRVINISDSLLHSIEESGDVEEIPSEDNDDMDDSSDDEDDLDDDKSSVSSEVEHKEVEVIKLNKTMEEPQEFEPESLLDIDATLLKSIHMTFPTDENIDYKKLSLNKLRQIVSGKNLSSDSSKLKKQDLLKLLGVE